MTDVQRRQAIRLHYEMHLPVTKIAELVSAPTEDVRQVIAGTFTAPNENRYRSKE